MPRDAVVNEPAAVAPGTLGAQPLRRLHVALLILILAIAGLLRVYQLGRQSLWFDEFLTLQESGGWGFAHEAILEGVVFETLPDVTSLQRARPWWSIWSSLHRDTEPPLYYVLVRGWRELFGGAGTSESVVRGVSVLASLASIALLFDVA